MCTIVIFEKEDGSNSEAWCCQDLKDNGLYVDPKDKPDKWSDEHGCLCGVDVQRIIERSGLKYRYSKVWDEYYVQSTKRREE